MSLKERKTMKIQLASIAMFAVSLSACSESPNDSEVQQIVAEMKEVQESLGKYIQNLEKSENMHEEISKFLSENGDQMVQKWNESLESCQDINTEKCNKLRKSYQNFKRAVEDKVKSTQDAAKGFIESRDS